MKFKVSFFLFAVHLFLILNGRGYADSFHVAPPPVQSRNDIFQVPGSSIGFPVTIDLSDAQKDANSSRIFEHGDFLVEKLKDASLRFGIYKAGDVVLNAGGVSLSSILPIRYKMQLNEAGVGWVGCGWDVLNKAEMVFESNLSWNPDWSVTSSTHGHLAFIDPCDLNRAGFDVDKTLAPHVKFYLTQVAANIDRGVLTDTTRFLPEIQAVWGAIQAPTHLFSDAWLTLTPSRFQISNVGGEGLAETAFLSLAVSPVVYLSRPHPPIIALPSLEKAPVGNADRELNIQLISKIKYSAAAILLKNAIVNKKFTIGGNEVTVAGLSLYPAKDKIVLKMDLRVFDSLGDKKTESSIYLWGTPTYSSQEAEDLRDMITIPDLDFTSETYSALNKTWPWLFHGDFLQVVKPLSVFSLDRNFGEIAKTVNVALNRNLFSSVKITGDLQPLQISVCETSENLEVRGVITGFVNLSEIADPGVVPAP